MMQKMLFSVFFFRKIDNPQFNSVNRSQYGNGCDFRQKILNIAVIIALYQQKDFDLSNVLIFQQVKITKNNI